MASPLTSPPLLGDPPEIEGSRELEPGTVLGRYRIVSVLQRGGMGEVFVAEDLHPPGGRVVIKRMLEDFVADEAYQSMFRAEARVMSRLRHPNIVRVVETPVLDGHLCLVMEFVEGRSVAQILDASRRLGVRVPPGVVLQIMVEALRGLHHAHMAQGEDGEPLELVHRDVSPGNLLVSFEGEVKVTDFGIAKSKLSVLATSVGVVKGTTRYLSPEQIAGAEVTARADLFACAAVMMELFTGRPLFDRGQVPPTLLAIVKGQRLPVGSLLPFAVPALDQLLEASLSLSAASRPESASQMADSLDVLRSAVGQPVGRMELGAYVTRLFRELEVLEAGSAPVPASTSSATSPIAPSSEARGSFGAEPLDAADFEPRLENSSMHALVAADLIAPPTDPEGQRVPPKASLDAGGGREPSSPHIIDEVESVVRQLDASPRRSIEESAIGMSDSAVEADAFDMARRPEDEPPSRRPPRFSVPSFALGLICGAAVFGLSTARVAPSPNRTVGAPAEVRAQETVRPIQLDPVRLTAPEPPAESPGRSDSNAADERSGRTSPETGRRSELDVPTEARADASRGVEHGYLTITRPRGARVYIRAEGQRWKRPVPVRRLRVPAGLIDVVIVKRRFKREVELQVAAGQHLDVSRPEIKVLEPAAPTDQ